MRNSFILFILISGFCYSLKGQVPGRPLIAGPDKICIGNGVGYIYFAADSLTLLNTDTIVWGTLHHSDQDIAPVSRYSVQISFIGAPPDHDSVMAQGYNASTGLYSDTSFVKIGFNPRPGIGNIVSTDSIVCPEGKGIYSVDLHQNCDKYLWYFQMHVDTTMSATDTLVFPGFQPGNFDLTVKGWNDACREAGGSALNPFKITIRQPFSLIVQEVTAAGQQVVPGDTVCGNRQVMYIAGNTFNTYKWLAGHGDSIIGSDENQSVTIRWGKQPGQDSLVLIVTETQTGCEGYHAMGVFHKRDLSPDPSTIWQFGCDMLVCSDSTAGCYQWFRDHMPFGGYVAPSGRYILDTLNSSSYTVTTCADTSCTCCNSSTPYQSLKMRCREPELPVMEISPNPASDIIRVKINADIDPAARLFMVNQYGRLVNVQQVTCGDFIIDISRLPAGLYFIGYPGGTGSKRTTKMIKF
ncbi:MAG: hypothetical protein NT040_02010 [Bacteroidetes bacterium]|nr:hypothetical protein [Bacteroidota bacterium]